MLSLPVSLDPVVVIGVMLVFLVGGFIKGAVGFGLPLTTMAILPLLVPVPAALAITVLVLLATNVTQFVQMRQMGPTLRRFWPVLGGIFLGVPAGTAFVSGMDDTVLLLSLGVFVVFFTLFNVLVPPFRIQPKAENPLGWLTGILAGVLGAITTASGPFLVVYLMGLDIERRTFVSALSLFFLLLAILISGAFILVGIMDRERMLLAAFALPTALVGMLAGNWLGERLPAKGFRTAVLIGLCILGLNLVWQGLAAITG